MLPRPVTTFDLQIAALDDEPIDRLRYLNARPGGGTFTAELALVRASAAGLPPELDGLLLTGDLQARALDDRRLLLGEALAERYAALAADGRVPPPDRVGVVLAGDLYAAPGADVRGASGCVVPVWEAFACRFRWVAGVLGNHDTLGDPVERQRFAMLRRAHLLDGEVVVLDGLRVAGVGGIIGPATNEPAPAGGDPVDQQPRRGEAELPGRPLQLTHSTNGPAAFRDSWSHGHLGTGELAIRPDAGDHR
jgi:hypothetical protein